MQNTSKPSEAEYAFQEAYICGNSSDTAHDVECISSRSSAVRIPLSFEQEQLWRLAQHISDLPVLHQRFCIKLTGVLHVAALEQSMNKFIHRYEIWRTSFPMVNGHPVQMIHPFSHMPLPLMDMRSVPEGEREREALRLATENATRAFDLAHGPLLRAVLLRLDDDDYRLFITLHHMIIDAISMYHVFFQNSLNSIRQLCLIYHLLSLP